MSLSNITKAPSQTSPLIPEPEIMPGIILTIVVEIRLKRGVVFAAFERAFLEGLPVIITGESGF